MSSPISRGPAETGGELADAAAAGRDASSATAAAAAGPASARKAQALELFSGLPSR